MRILHISTRLILGGSQENTVLSCEGQARLGHEVHLAFGPIYGPEGSLLERAQAFRTPEGRGIETHVVPSLVREIAPVKDWRCRRELRALIERLRPDVVHTHSSKAGIVGRAAGWDVVEATQRRSDAATEGGQEQRRAPGIVHTIHGPPFMPVEGGAVGRAKVRLKNWVYEVAERYAARRCHVIVSVADAMTRQYLARGIGRAEQYVTVRSGMEIGPFVEAAPGESRNEVRAALGLGEADLVVGTVARLAEHKGHDDLLEALGEELKANPHWRLLWVGDGWWRERLVARAREMGLVVREMDREGKSAADDGMRVSDAEAPSVVLAEPRTTPPPHAGEGDDAREGGGAAQVILTGLVPPTRVPAMVRAMDVLAHPSYREGLPRTVPQALLCGVVPVAYDVDGTGEACREMETGRLVRLGDRAGLREAVAWLAANPEQRAALAARGREECVRAFSAEAMVEALEGVYARAVAMARGRA
ncbi:MAG: glycosyltransferase [Phycisphaerales bacterium]